MPCLPAPADRLCCLAPVQHADLIMPSACRPYHAKMKAEERERIHNDWTHDRVQIIAATIAFGMGMLLHQHARNDTHTATAVTLMLMLLQASTSRMCALSCTSPCPSPWRATTRHATPSCLCLFPPAAQHATGQS